MKKLNFSFLRKEWILLTKLHSILFFTTMAIFIAYVFETARQGILYIQDNHNDYSEAGIFLVIGLFVAVTFLFMFSSMSFEDIGYRIKNLQKTYRSLNFVLWIAMVILIVLIVAISRKEIDSPLFVTLSWILLGMMIAHIVLRFVFDNHYVKYLEEIIVSKNTIGLSGVMPSEPLPPGENIYLNAGDYDIEIRQVQVGTTSKDRRFSRKVLWGILFGCIKSGLTKYTVLVFSKPTNTLVVQEMFHYDTLAAFFRRSRHKDGSVNTEYVAKVMRDRFPELHGYDFEQITDVFSGLIQQVNSLRHHCLTIFKTK
jgi:hypothetical protein